MKNIRNLAYYIVVTGTCLLLMYWIVIAGITLEVNNDVTASTFTTSYWHHFTETIKHNLAHPLALLLAQIVVIIFTSRFFGWLCTKIGQPSVIGEILAGIILGPSLVGMYLPEFSAALFPPSTLGNLQFLSQIGLVLFMFVVGMEIDIDVLKNKAQDAVVISHSSIIFPFLLGLGLAYHLYSSFAPTGVAFLPFGLFMGISMSITAFPVLARIVQERGIHKTRLGTIIITCAAADDITAWSILAAVIAFVKAGSFISALYTIALAVVYVLVMILLVRPFLMRVGDLYANRGHLSKPIVALFFFIMIVSAWATETIGIHALFGAFMAGTVMPMNANIRHLFVQKIEDVALLLLLPLFFVYTGLRTQIGLLNDVSLWMTTGLIIVVATVGKFLGSALAAKYVGQSWKDSLTIGALMNTRGLMELVVLNIGYDLGILTPEIFAMMVIMALSTTFLTGPALDLINKFFPSKQADESAPIKIDERFKILVSFGKPESGVSLVRLAHAFLGANAPKPSLSVMHLCPAHSAQMGGLDDYETRSFKAVIDESQRLGQDAATLFKVTNDLESDIADEANKGNYDMMLIGIGQSIFEGSLLGRFLEFTSQIISPDAILGKVSGRDKALAHMPFDERTKAIINKSKLPVGVLIDKGLTSIDHILVPIINKDDLFIIQYAAKLLEHSAAKIIVVDMTDDLPKASLKPLADAEKAIGKKGHYKTVKEPDIKQNALTNNSLVMVGMEGWADLVEQKHQWLTQLPSVLVMMGNAE